MNVAVTVNGARESIVAFEVLKGGVQRRILRRATISGAAPIRRQAKATVQFRDRTGLLRKSMAVKTKTYAKNGAVVSVIGSNRNVNGTYRGKKVMPANYAHLVELGHRTAVSKASGRNELDHALRRRNGPRQIQKYAAAESTVVRPRPFLANALAIAAPSAEESFARTFESALASEAKKAAAR